jgi:hypothetical protein
VKRLPERVILGNTFMNNRAIINYKTKEFIIEREDQNEEIMSCGIKKKEIIDEEGIRSRMLNDYKCLIGIKTNERWYNMVMGWILKFERAKDENGWMWAKVEEYKPEMKDEREVNVKEYIYSGERRKVIEKDIVDKIKKGILAPSNSKNGVPVILVEDDNIYTGEKDYRVCPNMIPINKKIKPIQYPGVSPREIADRVIGKYKTKIDIKTCYPHIRVAEGYSKYLAINVQHIKGYGNKFEYRGMPWGTTDAGRVLQREMDNMGRAGYEVGGKKFERLMKGECEESFQDDTILYNEKEKEHFEEVNEWLERMFAAGFPPNWNESEFCVEELRWCGMMLTKEGIRQIPERVEALERLKDPESYEQAERWVGMIGWHREFIKGLSGLMEPIYKIQKEERKRKEWRKRNRGFYKRMPEEMKGRWEWNEECVRAREIILEEMKKDIMLYRTDDEGILKIYVDYAETSGAIAAFLSQKRGEREVPISYASRKLRENEIGSGTPFCELLAIEFGIDKFEDIISGRETILYSDHKSLTSLNFKNPKGKWARILRKIIESGVSLESISGEKNVIADALCRLNSISRNIIILENDEDKKKIIEHNHIHLSDRKTIQSIRKRYNWEGISVDVKKVSEECDFCQRNIGRGEMRVPLIAIESSRPWEVISIDLCPSLTMKNGEKKSFGVGCDLFTKEVEAWVCKGQGMKEFLDKVEELMIEPLGVSKIICDNAEMFKSSRMKELRERHEIEVSWSVPHRHQANPVEKRIQTFKNILKEKLMRGVALRSALRETKNEMNNILVCDTTGMTPYEMRTGYPFKSGVDRKVEIFIEMRERQRKNVEGKTKEEKEKQKKYYDQGKKERKLRAGEWVLIENFYKKRWIEPKRLGPFKVEKVMENNNYLIYDHFRNNWKKYNIENLKIYNFSEYDKKLEEEKIEQKEVSEGMLKENEGGGVNEIDDEEEEEGEDEERALIDSDEQYRTITGVRIEKVIEKNIDKIKDNNREDNIKNLRRSARESNKIEEDGFKYY